MKGLAKKLDVDGDLTITGNLHNKREGEEDFREDFHIIVNGDLIAKEIHVQSSISAENIISENVYAWYRMEAQNILSTGNLSVFSKDRSA